ncbi:LRR [Nesidiocoris tenuis]|uniref:LRR n=1 Tax=Nesidiocoris tenuis TaxID=355587 RepID=A0ABN7ABB7_9HEMI|nr:LRR [Nesidiocoris tenuis]
MMVSTKSRTVLRLQELCMDALYSFLEKLAVNSNPRTTGPLDKLAGELIESLMERAYHTEHAWTTTWYLFLTPKIKRAYLPWDTKVWRLARNKCRNLQEVFVFTRGVKFKTMFLDLLPPTLNSLDLHGDLFYRGRGLPPVQYSNWLAEAEAWVRGGYEETTFIVREDPRRLEGLRWINAKWGLMDWPYKVKQGCLVGLCPTRSKHSLPKASRGQRFEAFRHCLSRSMKIEREIKPDFGGPGLSEVHLGDAQISCEDLVVILTQRPNLRLLRHYQLTRALCSLHGQAWRCSPNSVPTYRLTNIDADFSHVVRCRMEPTSVLPGDALRLAVTLCPDATSVHLRFDCSTPHHVVGPLTNLKKLIELSAVCVTSGERTLLDFTDLVPILDKFGPESIKYLELKVLEEIDPHVIGKTCSQLEVLTLSGCGYVTPPTCQLFRCSSRPQSLPRLKLLFYADGDDFSWDHSLPQCFWKATMSSSLRQKSRLEAIFLESPRISSTVLKEVFSPQSCFPSLAVISLCRSSEICLENFKDVSKAMPNLKQLRVSSCEKLSVKYGVQIKRLFPGIDLRIN